MSATSPRTPAEIVKAALETNHIDGVSWWSWLDDDAKAAMLALLTASPAARCPTPVERLVNDLYQRLPMDAKCAFMLEHPDGIDPILLALRASPAAPEGETNDRPICETCQQPIAGRVVRWLDDVTTCESCTPADVEVTALRPGPAASPAPAPTTGWRSISTAPRDGTLVIIWAGRPHFAWWKPDRRYVAGGVWQDEDRQMLVHPDATHWQPPLDAPAPPDTGGPQTAPVQTGGDR